VIVLLVLFVMHLVKAIQFNKLIFAIQKTVTPMKPFVTIEYCPKCGWLLRAAYMAQELLTTFAEDLKGVTLQPAEVSGRYTIYINDEKIFDRKEQGRFPEIKELKQLVRDKVNPEKSLGHSDKK
jgi:selenoprotein W-related protein